MAKPQQWTHSGPTPMWTQQHSHCCCSSGLGGQEKVALAGTTFAQQPLLIYDSGSSQQAGSGPSQQPGEDCQGGGTVPPMAGRQRSTPLK